MKYLLLLMLLAPNLALAQSSVSSATQTLEFGSPCTYPAPASFAHIGGITYLTYNVLPDGTISDVAIEDTSGAAVLDQAAADCISHWHVSSWETGLALTPGPHGGEMAWMIQPASSPARLANSMVYAEFRGGGRNCEHYYPMDALREGIEGATIVRFLLTAEGFIRDASVALSSGNGDLDRASIACVKFLHYNPTIRNGQPVDSFRLTRYEWQIK